MPSGKKSLAIKGKRMTRASDKASTSVKKQLVKKTVSLDNDCSYLQAHSVSVNTIPPSDHSHLSTGQTILTMLNKSDVPNK